MLPIFLKHFQEYHLPLTATFVSFILTWAGIWQFLAANGHITCPIRLNPGDFRRRPRGHFVLSILSARPRQSATTSRTSFSLVPLESHMAELVPRWPLEGRVLPLSICSIKAHQGPSVHREMPYCHLTNGQIYSIIGSMRNPQSELQH